MSNLESEEDKREYYENEIKKITSNINEYILYQGNERDLKYIYLDLKNLYKGLP